MTLLNPVPPAAPVRVARETLGRVLAVSGSQITIGLIPPAPGSTSRATVGKFLGIVSGAAVIVGLITEISERPLRDQDPNCRSTARIDIVGEIKANAAGAAQFQRGITDYPMIGESAMLMSDRELRLIYNGNNAKPSNVGVLHQDPSIAVQFSIEHLVSKHFAVIGTTGVGKSSGVAVLLQQILDERPDLRVFLIDPHNEYGRCFGDKAQVLTPRNLRLPFWLFNFEETVDAFFGGRPGIDDEVEILSEAIPEAKAAYVQLKGSNDRALAKKKDPKTSGYGVDTPVPYRIEDLITVIDDRMGKLENRSRTTTYNKLLQRIKTFGNDARYGFMFENATIGRDCCSSARRRTATPRPIPRPASDRRASRCRASPKKVVNTVCSSASSRNARPRSSQYHVTVQHHVRDAVVERSRPGVDPLGDLGRRRKHAHLRSLARHRRGVRIRCRRSAADADEVPRIAGGAAPDQRGRRQHPRRSRRFARSQHDRFRDRSLACLDHEQGPDGRRRRRARLMARRPRAAARRNDEISSRAATCAGTARAGA